MSKTATQEVIEREIISLGNQIKSFRKLKEGPFPFEAGEIENLIKPINDRILDLTNDLIKISIPQKRVLGSDWTLKSGTFKAIKYVESCSGSNIDDVISFIEHLGNLPDRNLKNGDFVVIVGDKAKVFRQSDFLHLFQPLEQPEPITGRPFVVGENVRQDGK